MLRAHRVGLEPVEHLVLRLRRNAGAVVGDSEHHRVAAPLGGERDGLARRRKADRVGQEIEQNLPQPPLVGSFTADERRLRQILFDLLSNAVGFSPPGETVTLAAERRSDAVVFTVTDHGPGIPPEAKDKVFDWFETDSMGSQHRGTRLGLSLVRSFVELHGGTVTIDSTLGQGTTVTCVFPTVQEAKQTAA